MTFVWTESEKAVDRVELSKLYRLAPLGDKPPASLRTVFSNSMFKCFVFQTAGSSVQGRAMADGLDCAYLADVAVHPDHQGRGLGKAIISRLVGMAGDHKEVPSLRQSRTRRLLSLPRLRPHDHRHDSARRGGNKQ
jgi:GNAT superfamily N-acetyltransferase